MWRSEESWNYTLRGNNNRKLKLRFTIWWRWLGAVAREKKKDWFWIVGVYEGVEEEGEGGRGED